MLLAGRITPAIWRAFLFWLVAVAGTFAAAPSGPPPELAQAGKPNAEEAAKLLEQFRQAGLPGQFYLQFELRSLPRRGQERIYKGRMWGGRNSQGALTRVELTDAEGKAHRLLIQNGARAAVWRWADGKAVGLGVAELFSP